MQLSIPPTIAAYFGVTASGVVLGDPLADRRRITIAQTFIPGRGWKRYPFTKRISRTWARRHLTPEGVTHVQLTDGGRFADFRIEEVR